MCVMKFPFYFENMFTANLISMTTNDNLNTRLIVEETAWVQSHSTTHYMYIFMLYKSKTSVPNEVCDFREHAFSLGISQLILH